MERTVIGVFDHFQNAERVITELTAAGVPRDFISVITPDERERMKSKLPGPSARHPDEKDELTKRVGAGAALGGVGGFLLSAAALAIPGIGPILAAGPMLAAISGAAAGGLVGALSSAGVAHEDAHFYAEALRRGYTVISVDTQDTKVEAVADIMNRLSAIDIDRRSVDFRKQGFTRFDETRAPLTRDEIIAERERFMHPEATTVVEPADPTFRSRDPAPNGGIRVISQLRPPDRAAPQERRAPESSSEPPGPPNL